MLPLYAAALAAIELARLFESRRTEHLVDAHALDDLVSAYPTSLYPTLSLLLQSGAYQAEARDGLENRLDIGMAGPLKDETALTLPPSQATELPLASASLDLYRLNNVVHQTEQRHQVLREAARVVRPGGLLQVTDNTVGWVDATWTVRLARALGREALAQRLIQHKLASSHQRLVRDSRWWEQAAGEEWDVVTVRPFFSQLGMTMASLFESLNFKQGGPGPDWLTRKVTENRLLRPVYRFLLGSLARGIARQDANWVQSSGATSLMVVLQRRGSC